MDTDSRIIEIELGVNIDHVATLREARGTRYPDPVHAALLAEQAGADGITAHLREDRRHVADRDIRILSEVIQTRLNMELAVTDEMIAIAVAVAPAHCCLVPERRAELTTEGGLDVDGQRDSVARACQSLAAAGCEVSLFIDPESDQIRAAAEVGAPVIELHTGRYADAPTPSDRQQELVRLRRAVDLAREAGLKVNAGHGLHYHNVQPVAAIPDITELNIGHAIIARAVLSGLQEAVAEMKRLMREARRV